MINNFPIPLNPTKGGTGLTSVTTGSLLYGSSTNVWSQLSIGSTGQVLQVSSGVPSWSSDIAGVGTGRTIYGGIASGTLTLLSSGDVSNYGSLSLSPGGATITANLYSVLVATTGELKYVRSGLTKLHVEGEIKTGVTGMMVSSDATLTPTRMLEVRSTSAQQRWSYDASKYAEITVSSAGHISILGNAGSQLAIGYGATAAGTGWPIAIGSSPSAGGASAIAIGRSAAAGSPGAIAIGPSAAANNDYSVAIGNSSSAAGSESVAIGRSAATGTRGVAIGYLAVTTGFTCSVALGFNAAATANNQFVSGSDGFPISNVHFGDGVVSATPTAWTLNGTGGSGTNIAGGALQIAGGKGTGNAAGGSVKIQASTAGASGTTLQTLATVAEFGASGNVGIGASVVSDVRLATSYTVTTDGAYRGIRSTLSNSGATSTSNYAIIGTLTLSGTTAITGTNAAIYGSIILNQSGGSYSSGAAVSLRGFTSQTGTTSITTAYGISGSGGISSSGGITTFAAIQASSPTLSSTGVISNNYGVNIADQGDATLVTTSYALRIGTQTNSATKSWAIGSAATQDSFLAGALMIGATSAPARMLHVISTSAQQRWSYDGSNYAEITVNSTGQLVISGAGTRYTAIAIGGASALAATDNQIAIGYLARTSASEAIAIGRQPTAASGTVAIGYLANGSTYTAAVLVGRQTSVTGNDGIAIGYGASAAGQSIAIGLSAAATGGTESIAIGRTSTTTAGGQFVAGGTSGAITDVYFNKGVTHATPTAWTLNGTGGAGTNIAGGALQIAGGKGTGNAAGGSVKIQASTAGASGTTLQTLATVAEFGPATIGFYGVTPVARPAAYTQTYSTADRTLSAYTADDESVAYTGAGDGEAQLADLNALRTAYENLRAFVEDIAQMLNSVTDDLQAVGLLQ